jgi:hypothetical protein
MSYRFVRLCVEITGNGMQLSFRIQANDHRKASSNCAHRKQQV